MTNLRLHLTRLSFQLGFQIALDGPLTSDGILNLDDDKLWTCLYYIKFLKLFSDSHTSRREAIRSYSYSDKAFGGVPYCHLLYWVKFEIRQLLPLDVKVFFDQITKQRHIGQPFDMDHTVRSIPYGSYDISHIFNLSKNLHIILYLEESFEAIRGWFGRSHRRTYSKFCWWSNNSTSTRCRIYNCWLFGSFWIWYRNITASSKTKHEIIRFDVFCTAVDIM